MMGAGYRNVKLRSSTKVSHSFRKPAAAATIQAIFNALGSKKADLPGLVRIEGSASERLESGGRG